MRVEEGDHYAVLHLKSDVASDETHRAYRASRCVITPIEIQRPKLRRSWRASIRRMPY
jgi:hypothetical protein